MVFVDLLQAPYPLGIDEQKRHQVVFNFEVGICEAAIVAFRKALRKHMSVTVSKPAALQLECDL
jgi:hypothetical protein